MNLSMRSIWGLEVRFRAVLTPIPGEEFLLLGFGPFILEKELSDRIGESNPATLTVTHLFIEILLSSDITTNCNYFSELRATQIRAPKILLRSI
jgi:hypothetical protein